MTCDWEIHPNCHTEAGVKPWGGTHGALLSLAPRAAARDRPECSSFTSDDIVFVIESAATSRSFRRFLGTPGGGRNGRGHATQQINARRCDRPFFLGHSAAPDSHPERRPPARLRPPPPGSPGACEWGWSRPRWSVWASAWSIRRRGWARSEGSLRTEMQHRATVKTKTENTPLPLQSIHS